MATATIPSSIHENNEAYAIISADYSPVGSVIGSSGYLFSDRYRHALWEARGLYGPRQTAVAQDWPAIREAYGLVDHGWFDRAAKIAGSVDLANACMRRGAYGSLNGPDIPPRWKGKDFEEAVRDRWEAVWAVVPDAVKAYKAYFARSDAAEAADRAEAAQHDATNGPKLLRVVEATYNRAYRDDPQCFEGNSWLIVEGVTA